MPPQLKIITREDSDFQQLETLRRNRNKRHRQRRFLVEGVRNLNGVLANGWSIPGYIYPGDRELSRWATEILATSRAEIHYALPSTLQARLSGKREHSELIAIVEMRSDDLECIRPRELPLVVVVDRSNSPGNLGTLIRSCDALGADGLIMTGHAVDLFDPDTIAASTGSLFALPVIRKESPQQLLPLFEAIRQDHGDLQLVGTSAGASRSLFEQDFWRPTILLIGNESDGLSHSYRELADVMVSIPMQGSASSLNVACAASIMLYEVWRQRNR